MVNNPPHYTDGGIETLDFIRAKLTDEEWRGYLKGQVLKYTSRCGKKNDAAEDVRKAIFYADRLARHYEEAK